MFSSINYRTLFSFLIVFVSASCANSPIVDKEATFYDQAAAEWSLLANDGNYVAQHNLGGLSVFGLGSTQQSL
jgi:hypothetical protein